MEVLQFFEANEVSQSPFEVFFENAVASVAIVVTAVAVAAVALVVTAVAVAIVVVAVALVALVVFVVAVALVVVAVALVVVDAVALVVVAVADETVRKLTHVHLYVGTFYMPVTSRKCKGSLAEVSGT
jgi:hypothetical protein